MVTLLGNYSYFVLLSNSLLLRLETFCFLSTWRRGWEGLVGGGWEEQAGWSVVGGCHAPFISRKVPESADSVSWTLSSIGTEKQRADYIRGQRRRRRLVCVSAVAAALSSARRCCTGEDFSNHVSKLPPLFTIFMIKKITFLLQSLNTGAYKQHFFCFYLKLLNVMPQSAQNFSNIFFLPKFK